MASTHDTTSATKRTAQTPGSIAGAPSAADGQSVGPHPFAAEFEALSADQQREMLQIARAAENRDAALEPVIAVLVDGPAAQRRAIADAFRTNPALRMQWNGMYGFLRSRG